MGRNMNIKEILKTGISKIYPVKTYMKKTQHSIHYNFIMNFILMSSQFLFPLITFPYVSRVLTASGNGRVSFAASVANYFLKAASLGIPTYGVRACAQVRDDREKLSRTVQEIFLINFVLTFLATGAYIICIFTVPKFYSDRTLFLINGVNIVLNMFGMNWFYRALEQYDYITARSLLFKVISVVLMFLLVHQQEDYVLYGAITVFAAVGSNILNFVRIHRYIEFRWTGNYEIKRHLKPIFILFAQILAFSAYTSMGTVMLGFMKTDVDVGYYNTAARIKNILLCLVTSLGNVLLPRMSYYVMKKKSREFTEIMLKALNYTVLISVPLTVYFVLFARESILFLAGNGYLGAVAAMQFIIVAVIPSGLTGVLGGQVLTALGREKYVLYSVIAGAVVGFLLNLVCIPGDGAAGAAFATMAAEFVVLFVQLAFMKGMLVQMYRRFRFFIYLGLSLVAGTVSCLVKGNGNTPFLTLFVSAAVFFALYGLGLLIAKERIIWDAVNILSDKIKGRRKR